MKTFVTLLIIFLSHFLFAQVDKTAAREKEILKQQHVKSRTAFRVGDTIPFQYEEFDKDGNLVLDTYLDEKQDTIEKYIFVYNSVGVLIMHYQEFDKPHRVVYWKFYHDAGILVCDSAFDKENHLVASRRHITDQQGRDSLIFSSKYDVQFNSTMVWDSGEHENIEIYGFTYDTTSIRYSGDTMFSHSLKFGSYIVVTPHNSEAYKSKIAEFYSPGKPYGTQKFQYDGEGNCITHIHFGADNRWIMESQFSFDRRNLKIKVVHTNKWSDIGIEEEYKYTFY